MPYIDRTEPDPSPPPALRTVTPHPREPNARRSAAKLVAIGRTVYKDVWTEFYDWEPGYCVEMLREVAPTHAMPPSRRVMHAARQAVAKLLAVEPDRDDSRASGNYETFQVSVTHYVPGATHGSSNASRLPTRLVKTRIAIPVVATLDSREDSPRGFPPLPRYESCAPSWRSMSVTDHCAFATQFVSTRDGTDQLALAFVPYADDPGFPTEQFQKKFERLEWERAFDPDVEVIRMETIRRLQALYDIDTRDVDRMHLFDNKCRLTHNIGLLWDHSQRDALNWPGEFRFQHPAAQDVPVYAPDPDDLRQRLTSHLRVFCPSINCLHGLCGTHGAMHTSTHIPSAKPRLTGHAMILSEGMPCGPDCFRHIADFDQFMETLPPSPTRSGHAGSLDALETVLGIAPDLFPCQLAVICLKPCKQVFVQRLQLFPDNTILSADADAEWEGGQQQPRRKNKLKFVDQSIFACEVLGGCAHADACTGNHCPCHEKSQHCTLACRCGVKCKRQWEGCNCINGRCSSASCRCAKRQRECVPGICINCDAGIDFGACVCTGHTGKPCDNSRMLRNAIPSKPIQVKRGKYGWGAFATHDMKTNTFLGTYTGHILDHELADPMTEVAKFVDLNYLFDFMPENEDSEVRLAIFDAARLGNSTRFLNHAYENLGCNVTAQQVLVAGEPQIGFFTSKAIKKGEELFLNYGSNYWKR